MAGSKAIVTVTNPSSRSPKGHSTKHLDADLSSTPQASMRPGKRRHQSSVSPVTARSESKSPKAKQRPAANRQSPPTIISGPSASNTAIITIPAAGRPRSESCSGSVSPSQLAVPRVSAEPPCPSMLPMPPMHWVAAEEKGTAQRQQCRAITESLLCHLTTSGIMVTA